MEKDFKGMETLTFKFGTYNFEVMPSVIMNSLSTFQRLMYRLFRDVPLVTAYL